MKRVSATDAVAMRRPTLANRVVTAVLRSPFRGLLGGRTMLISVRGRKTGRAYTTPVNYARRGDALLVVSRRERTWWRNLRGGGPVAVVLNGREISGSATVIEDDQERSRAAISPSGAGRST